MATKNDITGDSIQTRTVTDTYRNNYDLIFGKKKRNGTPATDDPVRHVHATPIDQHHQAPDHGQQGTAQQPTTSSENTPCDGHTDIAQVVESGRAE